MTIVAAESFTYNPAVSRAINFFDCSLAVNDKTPLQM